MNFPPFRPDLGELYSGTPTNVLMVQGGYAPDKLLAAAPGAAALSAAPRGSLYAVLPDGTVKVFVAIDTEVYELSSAYAWTALSASLDIPEGEDEVMTQFGVYLIGTNTDDGMAAYNMETPAGWNAISGAPAARYVFRSNNMLVALDCDGNGRRLKTSAFGDYSNWTTKGATTADMQDGEAFVGGADLGNGAAIILQRNAVRRMTWGDAGGGAVFRIDKLADGIGCVHPRSIVSHNGRVYFLHTDGFYMTDGASVTSIGEEKINRYIISDCVDLTSVYGAVDPKYDRVRWRYRSVDCASTTIFEDTLDYYWNHQDWVPGTQQTAALFRMATPAYTLEGLDALSLGLDSLPYPLDSRFWQGGEPNLSGLDANLKFGFFDGDNAAATIETATEQGPASMLVRSATPQTDDTSATLSLGVKDRLGDSITWKTAASIQTSGRVPLRGRGKLQRYRLSHSQAATWTRSHGVEGVEAAPGGPR